MTSIDYCLSMARKTPYQKGQSRHFACLVDKKGRIVSQSSNSYTLTHTKQWRYAVKAGRPEAAFLHAEMACLLKDTKRQGVKLYIARVDSKGNACYSAPCSICSLALSDFSNVKSVEYSI